MDHGFSAHGDDGSKRMQACKHPVCTSCWCQRFTQGPKMEAWASVHTEQLSCCPCGFLTSGTAAAAAAADADLHVRCWRLQQDWGLG
jgi:hypothetical protein